MCSNIENSGVTRLEERSVQTDDDGREWRDEESQTGGGHRKVCIYDHFNISANHLAEQFVFAQKIRIILHVKILLQTSGIQADLWLIGRVAEYEESACERMLKHISADAHKEQVVSTMRQLSNFSEAFFVESS